MKIPATVITGFLGAGKTTLIRHLIGAAGGRRLALLINEFGDLGIDREMLLGCGIEGCREDDIIELANGCICCTVADEFLPTMEKLMARADRPDHIVIETSGLALPKPLIKAFNWPEVRSRVTVDGVIAVIDAAAVASGRFTPPTTALDGPVSEQAVSHDWPLEEVFGDQLAAADLVLLNKTDQVAQAELDAVRGQLLSRLRPAAKVVATAWGAIDPRVALGLEARAEDDLASRPSCHDGEDGEHDHEDFATFVVDPGPIEDPGALEARIRAVAIAHDVLRIKGFVLVDGKPMRHVVQAVGPRIQRYYDRPWRDGERRCSELVVIGVKGMDQASIVATLQGAS